MGAAAANVLTGARSPAAVGEWITDAPRWVLRAVGFQPDPLTGSVTVPHSGTVRRLLGRLDGDVLDSVIGAFLAAKARSPDGDARDRSRSLRAIAVDGKTVRGSRTATRPAIVRLAAMAHTSEVLAQRQIADKSNEIPAFAPLLDTLDLTGTVITADALHTQHEHAAYLRERGAHYLAIVKRNHPGIHDRVRRLPWRDVTLDAYDRTRAHHREEIRRLKTAAFAHLDCPGARPALQVVGWRRDLETIFVLDTLEMAVWQLDRDEHPLRSGELIHHSDAGSQYTSFRLAEHLDTAGIAASIGSVGNAYDNALMESTIGLHETELIKPQRPWRTLSEVELATAEWVDWYNHRRLHGEIEHVPPGEYEANHYKKLTKPQVTTTI